MRNTVRDRGWRTRALVALVVLLTASPGAAGAVPPYPSPSVSYYRGVTSSMVSLSRGYVGGGAESVYDQDITEDTSQPLSTSHAIEVPNWASGDSLGQMATTVSTTDYGEVVGFRSTGYGRAHVRHENANQWCCEDYRAAGGVGGQVSFHVLVPTRFSLSGRITNGGFSMNSDDLEGRRTVWVDRTESGAFSFNVQGTIEGTVFITFGAGAFVVFSHEHGNPLPKSPEEATQEGRFNWQIEFLGACDGVGGRVLDGTSADRHENPISSARVELLDRNGSVLDTQTSSPGGYFCFALPDDIYRVRVTLIDDSEPKLLQTHHDGSADPVSATFLIRPAAYTHGNVRLNLSARARIRPTTNIPIARLSHVANSHYRSQQFVDWAHDRFGSMPRFDRFGTVKVQTFAGNSTRYLAASKTVLLSEPDSPFERRDSAIDLGPENAEWHEIGHHLSDTLEIAEVCPLGENHGGWNNDSTCDSLSEALPSFLAAYSRREIEPGTRPDAAYANFGSLETGMWKAWTHAGPDCDSPTPQACVEDEDLALTAVLWDLVDAFNDREHHLCWKDGSPAVMCPFDDQLNLDVTTLIRILSAAAVSSVVEMRQALVSSVEVPAFARAVNVDPNGDGTRDITPIDALLVSRGFHVADPDLDAARSKAFRIGSQLARTDHVYEGEGSSRTLKPRHHTPEAEGSAIAIRNGAGEVAHVRATITYPTTTTVYEWDALPGTVEEFALHLPPHFWGRLGPGRPAPSCSSADPALRVSVTLESTRAPSMSFTNCDLWFAIAAADEAPAMTFDAATQPIDVVPTEDPNTVTRTGTVSVAVLSSQGRQAAVEIAHDTIRFGVTGDEDSLARHAGIIADCSPPIAISLPSNPPIRLSLPSLGPDVNGDGRQDLVCVFDLGRTGLSAGTHRVTLTARTTGGAYVIGHDIVTVV